MSTNISKQTRNEIKEFLTELKEKLSDDESIIKLNEIENAIMEKKYGLVWEEHEEDVDHQLKNKIPVFREKENKEIINDKKSPYNFLLEGDNLHSLYLLEKTHKGKVDFIYIDPPYNLGDDFIYNDNYVADHDNYRHSKWISFMSRRLNIAKHLLSSDGKIFISIDNAEFSQLKLLCDEIFGEHNSFGVIVREAVRGGSRSNSFRDSHDYVLCYAKNINEATFSGIEVPGIELDLKDDRGPYARGRELNKWGAASRREDSPTMWFPIPGPNGEDVYPIRNDGSEGRWRLGKKRMMEKVENDDIIFTPRGDGTYICYEKIRDNPPKIQQFTSLFLAKYQNSYGAERLKKIFNTSMSVFDYAKPVELIKDLLLLSDTREDALVLDFFAGSGTTAEAVLELNKEDGGNRKFILCTNNESNICEEITYPRIDKVINGYEFKGEERTVLYEKRFNQATLRRMEKEWETIERIKKENENKYDRIRTQFSKGIYYIYGITEHDGMTEKHLSNLMYYKTDYINRYDKNDDSYLTDELMDYIKEMVQLEYHERIDNVKNIIIYNDNDLKEIFDKTEVIMECRRVFKPSHVFLNRKQEKLLNEAGVKIITIPNYYFSEELRSVGEL